MVYQEFAPAPALSDVVASYWRFSAEPSHGSGIIQHIVPPDGAVSLCRVPAEVVVIVGPRISALRVPVQPGAEYVGVRFMPGAAGPVLGIDVPSLRERTMTFAREDFCRAAGAFAPAALDALIQRWRAAAPPGCTDPIVREFARRIVACEGAIPVSRLIEGLELGYRQVLRRFYQAIGLTPKEYARIRRIRAACVQAIDRSDPGWASVAASSGFADQSHMAREFRDVFGWPPCLVHEYLRRIEHRHVRP